MKVVLTSVCQTRGKIFFLNNNDTIGQAKSLWAKEEKCDTSSFVLASGGRFVSDDVVLEELPQLYPGIMELLVDVEVLLPVRAFRLQDEAKALTSFCSMRAEELYGSARELLGIAEGHETRFRVGDRVLAGERTLLENLVDAASGVDVEVGWRATVQRVGCCDEEVVLFFSEVLSAVASPWRRVLCGDRLLRSAAEVEALLVSAFEASHAERLVLEESSPVSVQEDGAVKCEAVWPQKGLMSEDAPSEVMFEDRVMAGGDPQSLVVPPPWVLHRAPLHLVARLTSGRRTVLRVPRDGAVSDVVKAARPLEGARRKLQLVVGCREVDAHASLRALGLQDGSHVRLLCPPSSIVVFLGKLLLRWELPLTQDVASFGEIVAAVSPGNSPGNRTRRRILLSGLLVCEGCGRRLSKERQAFQSVPAACCELRSMRLRFATKTAPRNAGVLTVPPPCEEGEPRMTDAESQTDGLDLIDSADQTPSPQRLPFPSCVVNAGSQTDTFDVADVSVRSKTEEDCLRNAGDHPILRGGRHFIGIVYLDLPGGLVFLCGNDRTPRELSDSLRRKSCVFRIDDLVVQGRSLASNKGWKKQTLKENGVNDGDQVTVKTSLPRNVEVLIWEKSENYKVIVNVGENCWERIRGQLPVNDAATFNVFYQKRLYYQSNNEQRSCVVSRLLENGESENCRYVHLDEEDGRELRTRDAQMKVREFLTPTQGLRAAPIGSPVLFVSSGDVLGFQELPNGSSLISLSPAALFDSQYVAMIVGLRFYSRKNDHYIALYTRSEQLAFTHGGNVFNKISEIRKLPSVQDKKSQRLWILLRENDLIPHWNFPRSLGISLYRREGVDLQIVNERLVRKNSETSTEGSRWIMPQEADELDDNFNTVVRNARRKNCHACFCR